MVQVEVERVAPRGQTRICQSAKDRWRQRLEEDAAHTMPEPHAVTLGRVVQERRAEQIRVVVARLKQAFGDVQPMTAIGDRHRVEQPDAAVGKDPTDERRLVGVDPGADVRDELSDPMHR